MINGNGFAPMVMQESGNAAAVMEGSNLVKAESMDITNDPRFFTDNVLDKRLAAFGGLAVVSGLMVQTSMDEAFGMRKFMDLTTYEGIFQLVGFVCVCLVLFFNMLATYVGVAQPYHTYRLMTAGPTGFEAAAAYYLHHDVVAWRHLSVKLMLVSLPIYFFSSGLRLAVKFDRDLSTGPELPSRPPNYVRLQGLVTCVVFVGAGLCLAQIHWRHEAIFKGIYETMYHGSGVGSIMSQLQRMMTPRTGLGSPLDV